MRIAVIVAWFGPLPAFFPAWLRSAEMNPDVDFFLFFDQEVKSEAENIHIISTTLEAEVQRAEKALGESVTIKNAYKFCDLRPFFGLVYEDFLKGYDFWGYCDIDLVFGQIRKFLTDDVLGRFERFYEWGHFSLLRNCEWINHIYDLPGCLYTRDETLRKAAKVNAEEHYGLNRICEKNSIRWYKEQDFADFSVMYSDLVLHTGARNYPHQVFYWENGRVYQAFVDADGTVETKEYVYIHWQKRKPAPDDSFLGDNSFYVTSERLLKKEQGIPTQETIVRLCPDRSEGERKKEMRAYVRIKLRQFIKAPLWQKLIWLRQKRALLRQTGNLIDKGKI